MLATAMREADLVVYIIGIDKVLEAWLDKPRFSAARKG